MRRDVLCMNVGEKNENIIASTCPKPIAREIERRVSRVPCGTVSVMQHLQHLHAKGDLLMWSTDVGRVLCDLVEELER